MDAAASKQHSPDTTPPTLAPNCLGLAWPLAPAVGDVINHGKHDFWGRPGVHYHQGMKAGENTLNALCARLVLRGMAENKG